MQNGFHHRIMRTRDQLLAPLLSGLTRLRVSADAVSIGGVFMMVWFFVAVVAGEYTQALLALLLSVLADLIDGPLARFKQHKSSYGRIIDVSCDTLSFIAFITALAYVGVFSWPLAVLLVIGDVLLMGIGFYRARAYARLHQSDLSDMRGFWVEPSFVKGILYACFVLFVIGNDFLLLVATTLTAVTYFSVIMRGTQFYLKLRKA